MKRRGRGLKRFAKSPNSIDNPARPLPIGDSIARRSCRGDSFALLATDTAATYGAARVFAVARLIGEIDKMKAIRVNGLRGKRRGR